MFREWISLPMGASIAKDQDVSCAPAHVEAGLDEPGGAALIVVIEIDECRPWARVIDRLEVIVVRPVFLTRHVTQDLKRLALLITCARRVGDPPVERVD